VRTADLIPGQEYMAYCGALARVRVIEKGLPHRYHDASREMKNGVLVEAQEDVKWAADVQAAAHEGRSVKLVHRAGAKFIIPARDVSRPA
jgi:hypothetical protein